MPMPPRASLATKLSGGFFILMTLLAFWGWNPLDGVLAPAALVFCAVCALALQRCLHHRQTMLAVYVVQSGLVFSFGSVRGSRDGLHLNELAATASSVSWALLVAALFVAVVTAVAVAFRPRRSPTNDAPQVWSPDVRTWLAVIVLLAACFADAVRGGTWTAYTGSDTTNVSTGGFRLELLYSSLLVAVIILMWREISARWVARDQARRAAIAQWAVLGVLLILLFMLQGRRFMITCLVFSGLTVVQSGIALNAALRSRSRQLLVVGAAALVFWGTFFGSRLWRQAAETYGAQDLSLGTRIHLMMQERAESDLSDRMTYLALDAASVENYIDVTTHVSLVRMASSSLMTALPGALFPWKYDEHGESLPETCETAFRTPDDLPCTPEAEALLGGGPVGVLVVSVLWGIFFALLARLANRRQLLWQVVALVGFIPMSVIETSAFPMIQSLRTMALVGGLVWAGSAALRRLAVRRLAVRSLTVGR